MTKYEILTGTKSPIKAWIDGVAIESTAVEQMCNIANLPFIYKHVAVMPDVHAGIGATVGTVIPTLKAIVPAAVGVDLGCGMCALRVKVGGLPNLTELRAAIEAAVPHGRSDRGGPDDVGAWSEIPERVSLAWAKLEPTYLGLVKRQPGLRTLTPPQKQLGTLGSGNHFVEVCLDENQDVWVMLHSGSRGVGGRIGQHFIDLAKQEMVKYFITLPDANLAYLPEGSPYFADYIEAVSWAQQYAKVNRELMLETVIDVLRSKIPDLEISDEVIDCHHNYVAREHHFGCNVWVTRKGAIRARLGDLGIIPGSMGARSFIVRGLGNKQSFCSASHGAGRRMSRTEARRHFTLEDHLAAVSGVECRVDSNILDETPGAYKDIDAVMAAQSDLVEIVHTLKQVVCVKG